MCWLGIFFRFICSPNVPKRWELLASTELGMAPLSVNKSRRWRSRNMPNTLAVFVVEYHHYHSFLTPSSIFIGFREEKECWYLGMQRMQKGSRGRCLGPWHHHRCHCEKHGETFEGPGRILNPIISTIINYFLTTSLTRSKRFIFYVKLG